MSIGIIGPILNDDDDGGSEVTLKQAEHVLTTLKRFGVHDAGEVKYSPKYGWIEVPGAKVSFESLVIKGDGAHAFNYWQIDGVDAHLDWVSPEEEQARYKEAATARRRERYASVRDEPYPTRSRSVKARK
jgi:hypothetical protein